MKLFDKVKSKLGFGGKVDEVVQNLDPEEVFTGNRAYIRAWERSQRLKGPGYTRAMRKGRTQRTLHVPEDEVEEVEE